MQIGIVTRSFPEMSNEEAAAFMADTGFTVTELCLSQIDSKYWVYNGMADLSDLPDKRVCAIADTYRRHGINVHALGVFTNLIEEDDERRQELLRYFERYMQYAQAAGIPVVATECGFDPASRGIRSDVYEERFGRLIDSLSWLCEKAEKYDVTVALEPCVLDVVPSAKRMADTISQVGSSRLKVLLDPANLIANSSEKDVFAYLGPHIAYFHGKDRKVNDAKGRLVGDGEINWPLFFSLYHQKHEHIPVIIEYANAGNAAEILQRVRDFDRQAIVL
ncbi:MAG: sugar phosphate isomerase/epimerase [Ruminococcaceae bacterium]|jgi:sugar phosphate isomerase/epimerase|nr:sugar phosphate isomerase/epimerase [Oscillospiraceae bacterium]